MTRDQMHNTLRYVREQLADERGTDYSGVEALDMVLEELEQEPSGDLINREELLKAINTWDKFGVDDTNSLFRLDNLSLHHYVPYIHYDDVVKCIKGMPSVNPVTSGDLISRQAVIDVIKSMSNANPSYWNKCDVVDREDLIDEISELPSVKQEPKTGHWIKSNIPNEKYVCSECGGASWYYDCQGDVAKSKYCPNCGARMKSEE